MARSMETIHPSRRHQGLVQVEVPHVHIVICGRGVECAVCLCALNWGFLIGLMEVCRLTVANLPGLEQG